MTIAGKDIFKKYTFIIHLLVWAVIFSLPFIFNGENQRSKDVVEIAFRNLNTATIFLWMGVFYLNAEILIPALVFKKKYLLYILLIPLIFFLQP
jgi:hypothetical protein